MGNLFQELKRRNVFRVAIAYAVASWLLVQVADLILDNIGAPAWVMQVFMLALVLGFPPTLLFAWAFEITPEGLKREKEVDRERSITGETARKLDRITIGLLLLVLVVFGVQRLFPAVPSPASPQASVDVPDESIAVLAFKDLSPEGDQAYFAEGISEELLNVLAQIPDFKVAGRTSSFAFKEAMLEHLRRAVERHYANVSGLDFPGFDPWRGHARFIELEAEVLRRAKEERRKLGLIDA